MFCVCGPNTLRFRIILKVIVTVGHPEAPLAEVDNVPLAVPHILVYHRAPHPARTDTFEMRTHADNAFFILNSFDAVEERLKRCETLSPAFSQIHSRAIQVSYHPRRIGRSPDPLASGLLTNLFKKHTKLSVGCVAKHSKRAPARLRLWDGVALHPAATRVVEKVVLWPYFLINIADVEAPATLFHTGIV